MHSGTIAFCSREDHIPPPFAACLARLMAVHPDAKLVHLISNDIADARNSAVRQSEGDWLWFIDTDMLFAPETLQRLLAHGVDLVQVLCLMRHPPHEPVMYQHSATVRDALPIGSPRLVEVQSLGSGGTLYRRKVFEAVPSPWFEGVLGTEDTRFAQKARLAGFPLYVDMATPVGHLTPMAVWPRYDGREWGVRFQSMTGHTLDAPYPESVQPLIRA